MKGGSFDGEKVVSVLCQARQGSPDCYGWPGEASQRDHQRFIYSRWWRSLVDPVRCGLLDRRVRAVVSETETKIEIRIDQLRRLLSVSRFEIVSQLDHAWNDLTDGIPGSAMMRIACAKNILDELLKQTKKTIWESSS